MRVLITGASGQLGRDLQEALAQEEVHAADHARLDIANRDAVFDAVKTIRPAWIINAAAFNDVDGAESQVELAFKVNGAGPGHLADAAVHTSTRLVHISTDYVFDGGKGSPYDECDTPNPQGVYARSKYEGEVRVLNSGAAACVLRTAWLYGRHGRNFVKTILSASRAGTPIKVVRDQIGSPTATADLSQAIGALIRARVEGLFHAVNTGACSRFELAQAIVGDRVRVVPIFTKEAARPAPRPANSSLTSVRWPEAGLPAFVPWREALDRFLSANPDL